ncbi:MAG: hypothetical protein COT14_02505 [Candidatus Diapherotrites archaeon CG08_land_8_20_14_0_20_30_16]|nr:MAG: hypothetical protein COT14_02505 [Candidatus Diapherotrites archaeon CG08_land_8_20_14_0_20_30_16]
MFPKKEGSIEFEINIKDSINASAQRYFDDYKKIKKKLIGLDVAITNTEKRLSELNNKKIEVKEVMEKKKLAWYEKYHWGYTRAGFLIIAGKDAQSNEYIVKNHLEKDDLLFHSTIQGSAHVILKNGQKAEKDDLEDCALFAAIFSKAWNLGFASVDVYFVYPDQVSKTPETGEYLSQGAFVIRGEKNFFKKVQMILCLGIIDIETLDKNTKGKRVFIGSEKLLLQKGIKIIAEIIPGKDKKGDIAKQIHNRLDKEQKKEISLDEVIQCLPPGTLDFVKKRK